MWSILCRCAAVLTSAALVGGLSGAPAALAEDFSRVDRDPVQGNEIVLSDGTEVPTALFSLRVADSASVSAYTAEADGEVRQRAAYVESAWDDGTRWTEIDAVTDSVDRATWVVANSYPHVALADLAMASETIFLDERQAIAGTQAALWHVLDGVELDPGANDTAVTALYEYLVAGSEDAPDDSGAPSLKISPTQLETVAPEKPLGPLTVTSSGTEPVRVAVRGAPASWLVDADGEQVRRVHDGESVYLDVDPSVPAGVVTLHVRGDDVPLPEGRLFTGRDGVRTQPLITAEPGTAARATAATLTWHSEEPEEIASPEPATPAPSVPEPESAAGTDDSAVVVPDATPSDEPSDEPREHSADDDLAGTGTWLSGLLIIAGALVVSGLIILVLGRKRRN
ncbi:thioester domain-containing protein [Nocardiopsis sp. EMB25]|uniref:thioester domain-containing protein n=1 Tax=Nocardiopsis sp. EMB25 TaxID=2835867 RepID=UPI0022836466|nr:Cys-Gln thioester bond-forming surface protein [Nocardiopsis sp. EMB25]MCY9787760.1 thioester domain-containing protein [Nocardiopsis sp. EMB25]